MKLYRIGELAKKAGVSRRTIDYYTNMGLLNPLRLDNNYRYYNDESLIRLRIIEGMKLNRYTLEEIKNQLGVLDQARSIQAAQRDSDREADNISFIKRQLKIIESQLEQLNTKEIKLDCNKASLLKDKIMVQSMALIHSLMIYINELN